MLYSSLVHVAEEHVKNLDSELTIYGFDMWQRCRNNFANNVLFHGHKYNIIPFMHPKKKKISSKLHCTSHWNVRENKKY